MPGMTLHRVTLPEVELRYRVHGSGPDVLLLHGWISSGRMWQPLMAALGGHFRLWAPDLAGFGDSPLPADGPPRLSLADHARHIRAFCRALDVRPYAVVGHSLGGLLTLHLALEYPDLMERLVLISPVVSGRLWPVVLLRGGVGHWLLGIVRRLWPLPVMALGPSVFAFAPRHLFSEAARRKAEDAQKASRRAAVDGLQIVLETDYSARLPEIDKPTLVIVGTRDITVPPTEGELAAARIPGARLVKLPGVAHQVTDEAPDEVHRLLLEFLAPALLEMPHD